MHVETFARTINVHRKQRRTQRTIRRLYALPFSVEIAHMPPRAPIEPSAAPRLIDGRASRHALRPARDAPHARSDAQRCAFVIVLLCGQSASEIRRCADY